MSCSLAELNSAASAESVCCPLWIPGHVVRCWAPVVWPCDWNELVAVVEGRSGAVDEPHLSLPASL